MLFRWLFSSLASFVAGLIFGACCLNRGWRVPARREGPPPEPSPPDVDAAPL